MALTPPKLIRVIVAGSRSIKDAEFINEKLDFLLQNQPLDDVEIVSGDARGPDRAGARWARRHDVRVTKFPANWRNTSHPDARPKRRGNHWYDANAGYRRNKAMASYATHLVAFWDGQSRGTKHMIQCARENGLTVKVYRLN